MSGLSTLRRVLAVSFALAPACWGQGLTASLSGSVQDSSGAAIPGATVRVVNTATSQSRQTVSDASGAFVVTELLRGTYRLTVTASGFRTHEQTGIVLTANERLVLHDIVLDVGQLSESVTVTAEGARLQTQSSERSGLISTEQIEGVTLKGRDYLGLVRLLPGVVDTQNREAPGASEEMGLNVNGARTGTINLTLDGVSNLNTGSMRGVYLSPDIDSVAEVKVLLTNYQAEYGRSSGGTINVITKGGSNDFHGVAFYFKRHEWMNANGYFNNRDRLAKPLYRFDYPGYNIGGPIYIPGKFNRNRDKLFFFWSQDFFPRDEPSGLARRTMPTELERRGDFSRTLDTNGRLIPVQDPLNGRQAFPGNVIPASRLNRSGQGLLNIFPLPNATDPNNTFNYVFQENIERPRREEILRVDWNIGPKTTFYARAIQALDGYKGAYGFTLASTSWPLLPIHYEFDSKGLAGTLIHTFSPSLVNVFTIGFNRGDQTVRFKDDDIARIDRNRLGLNLPQFHPEINPYNVIPRATFGGVTNAPALDPDLRFPFIGTNPVWNITDNVTKVLGSHNLKFGIFVDLTARNGKRVSTPMGQFDFGRDVNNPLDSNYAYSNAVLGNFRSYAESDANPFAHGRFSNLEWFAQDNWRVNRRLTLDLGVRFYRIVPAYGAGDRLALFSPDAYDPARAPLLIEPYRDPATNTRVGRDPVTGQILPAVKIGAYAASSGDIYNGMIVANEQIMQTPPVQVSPRIGFAFDVFGNGKTAIRGGFGAFPDRIDDTSTLRLVQQPPLVNTPVAHYSTIPDLLSTPLSRSPGDVVAMQTKFDPPTTYNWSFGVQQDIGWRTALDVAYVGNVVRHMLHARDLNATRYGTNFRPESIDRTNNQPLPANFLRPYRGYASIPYSEFASNSNYHSLQTQVNRRFTKGLTFGVSWTWSKTLDYVDGNGSAVNPFIDIRTRHYGKAGFDRLHNFVFNYIYDLPKVSATWRNGFSRWALDNWQVSGITSFITGQPLGIGYSFVTATDITGAAGAGVDSRVILTGSPVLPKSERTPQRHFNTSVVRAPDASNFGIGNAPKDPIRGPGINNWDISLFKNFPIRADGRMRAQFRFEMYNAFNHTQFAGVDTGARFDARGVQVNGRFGEYTSARDSRRIQLGLKFYY